jgi:hypothetical protein
MRCHWIAAALIVCLLAPSVRAGDLASAVRLIYYPIKKKGLVKGTLTVAVAEPDAPLPPWVRYELTVSWPRIQVHVEEPEIVDPAKAWKSSIPWGPGGGAESVTVYYRIVLRQTKPGVQPLPGIKLRFHTLDKNDWDELVWNSIATDPPAPSGGYTYPAVKKDDTEGVLTVTVADEDTSKPAEVDYRFQITTAADTKVEPPTLRNAEAWNSTESPLEIDFKGNRQIVRFHLHLEQKKPGVEPLPGVTVHFRKDGQGERDDLTWTDILKETRELPRPPVTPICPPLQQSRSLWWSLGIVALLFALLGVALRLLWGKKLPSPPTPAERALRELERIEGLGLAGPDETGWYPEEISSVIRRFLSERFGLPAQQQTTAEFLHTMRQTPELWEEVQQTLKELLERCDLAKFAAMRTPPEECRRIAALARAVVQQTSAVKEEIARS